MKLDLQVRNRRREQHATPVLHGRQDTDFACKAFAKHIVGNSQDVAINEWFASVTALRELAEEVPMFRPFMTRIAKLLLERPDTRMIKRVGLGAVLSLFHMLSDAIWSRSSSSRGTHQLREPLW